MRRPLTAGRSQLSAGPPGPKSSLCNLPGPSLWYEPRCIVEIRQVQNVQTFSRGQTYIPITRRDTQ